MSNSNYLVEAKILTPFHVERRQQTADDVTGGCVGEKAIMLS
jgi:hypothetical protein